jgi:hypothetical protein
MIFRNRSFNHQESTDLLRNSPPTLCSKKKNSDNLRQGHCETPANWKNSKLLLDSIFRTLLTGPANEEVEISKYAANMKDR